MGLELPPRLIVMGANPHNTGGRGSSNNSGTGQQNNGNTNGGSSSDSEDWDEGSWTVDCPCGVNFDDGEEMIECDECSVWVHTACCQVPAKPNQTYVCDKCKEKKRKEREESEVAQLLVELPGKTVCFGSNELLPEVSIERQVHEHGAPGGDPSFFVGVSPVFSQQLWKAAGYVPKMLQVHYAEIPNWQLDKGLESSELDLPQRLKETSRRAVKRLKEENKAEEVRRPKLLVDEDAPRKGKRLEVLRHSKQKYKFRGIKDEKTCANGKRAREDLKESLNKKKLKISPEVKVCYERKRGASHQSPKNPKAMKKTAVQEFMDGDVRLCSKCLSPQPASDDDQECPGKPNLCQECQRTERSGRKHEIECENQQPKKCRGDSLNISPGTASTELSKQNLDASEKPLQDEDYLKREAVASTEEKHPRGLQGSQLTIKTSMALKSDIPSPASINSGGPTAPSKLGADVKVPPSPKANKLVLQQQSLLKSSCSSKLPVTSPSRKADGCVKSSARSLMDTSTSVKQSASKPVVQTSSSNQIQSCKTSLSHGGTRSGHGLLVKRQPTLQKNEEAGRDEKSDKEIALLLHQQLNSSPRVPRVPRVRQSSQPAPSNSLGKRTGGHASAGSHKGLKWRQRYKEDNLKETFRENCSKYGETPLLTAINRKPEAPDDDTASSRTDSPEASEGGNEVASAERPVDQGESRKHSSPTSDADDRTNTAEAPTLPGPLDQAEGNRLSSEDAVLPHNLCKINGERYSYPSASQLDSPSSDLLLKKGTKGKSKEPSSNKCPDESNDDASSSSDGDVSNYSEEDEEMVVHRSTRQMTVRKTTVAENSSRLCHLSSDS